MIKVYSSKKIEKFYVICGYVKGKIKFLDFPSSSAFPRFRLLSTLKNDFSGWDHDGSAYHILHNVRYSHKHLPDKKDTPERRMKTEFLKSAMIKEVNVTTHTNKEIDL